MEPASQDMQPDDPPCRETSPRCRTGAGCTQSQGGRSDPRLSRRPPTSRRRGSAWRGQRRARAAALTQFQHVLLRNKRSSPPVHGRGRRERREGGEGRGGEGGGGGGGKEGEKGGREAGGREGKERRREGGGEGGRGGGRGVGGERRRGGGGGGEGGGGGGRGGRTREERQGEGEGGRGAGGSKGGLGTPESRPFHPSRVTPRRHEVSCDIAYSSVLRLRAPRLPGVTRSRHSLPLRNVHTCALVPRPALRFASPGPSWMTAITLSPASIHSSTARPPCAASP